MIYVKRLHPDARMPTRGSPLSAGLDLYACETVVLPPGSGSAVRTGIAVEILPGNVGLIWPRSGLSAEFGIDTLAGVVDADYRGEVVVVLAKHGSYDYTVRPGERIAQLLIQPVALCEPCEVQELSETGRGAGGFGSTGA